MNQQLLFADLSKLLEMPIEAITLETNLQKHSYWDSLAMISLIGAIDEHYQVTLSGEELMQAVTVKDVYEMVAAKIVKSEA